MFVHQGIGQWYIGGGAVSTGMKTSWGAMPARTALSESFSAIGRAPWIIIIMLGCVFVAYLFLNFTKHGRYLYAMGGNKEAAKLSGIDVKKYRYLAGMITAVFIAVGGILVASRGSSAQVMCCDNYLMPSLAAVFVGRTVGGAEKPNALGTMIGAMLVSTLENGLTICAVPFYVLPAVKGAVLAPVSYTHLDVYKRQLQGDVHILSIVHAYTAAVMVGNRIIHHHIRDGDGIQMYEILPHDFCGNQEHSAVFAVIQRIKGGFKACLYHGQGHANLLCTELFFN